MRRLQAPLVALLFFALAVLLTWPQLPNAASSTIDLGDPLETVWTLRWIASRLPFDLGSLYSAPIFSGFPLPLAYDDTSLAPGVVAWLLIGLTGDALLSYNLIMVGCYVANGLAVFLLARYATRNAGAGLLAGIGLTFSTYTFAHISHLNLLSFFPLPLALLALHRWLDRLTAVAKSGGVSIRQRPIYWFGPPVMFVFWLVVQAMSTFYYLAYLGLAAGFVFAWWALVLRGWRGWQQPTWMPFGGQLLLVAVLSGVALLAFTAPYREVTSTLGFERTRAEQEAGAARPIDYLSVSPRNHLYAERLPQLWPEPLFLGGTLLVLAGAGVVLSVVGAVRGRRVAASRGAANPRWLFCYLGLALFGFVLSFGPTLQIGEALVAMPYRLLELVPGGSALRGPARLVTLVLLGLGVVGGWAAMRIAGWLPLRRFLAVPFVMLLAGLMCYEQITAPQPSTAVPLPVPQAYHWLATQPAGIVAEFPISIGLNDPTVTAQRLFYQGAHNRPLLNGHASFLPPVYQELALELDGDILEKGGEGLQLTPSDVGILQSLGVRYVMFDRTLKFYKTSDWNTITQSIAAYQELAHAAYFEDDWLYTIYTLNPLPAESRLRISYQPTTTARTAAALPLTLTISNPYHYPLLSRLRQQLDLQVRWLGANGSVSMSETISLATQLTLPPGDNSFPLTLQTPSNPGRYTLDIQPVAPAPAYNLTPAQVIDVVE